MGPLHRVVDVRARTPVAHGGLGHERDEHAVLLGDLLQQHAQEHQPVRHPQDVGVVEVELELRVAALGDHILQTPAELLEDVDERAEISHGIEGVLDVVAERLSSRPHALAGKRVVVERLDRLAVTPAHDEELRLDARESRKPLRRGIADRAPERVARAQVVRRVLPPQIGEHPRAGAIPGTDGQGVEIGHRDLVGVGRRQFGYERDRVHGELRALAHAQVLEIAERHRLGLRHAEHVDPAGEHIADPCLFELRPCLAHALDVREGLGHVSWCCVHQMFLSLDVDCLE